jgi:hypothetical protein
MGRARYSIDLHYFYGDTCNDVAPMTEERKRKEKVSGHLRPYIGGFDLGQQDR